MSRPVQLLGMAAWLALVRAQQRVGTAGVLGLMLLCAAGVTTALGWLRHQDFERERAAPSRYIRAVATAALSASSSSAEGRAAPLRWPSVRDVPLLLTRIERAAVEQGLGWPQADYRVNAGTAEVPGSLEVRCSLKGPYPSVRRFVTALLLDQPTLTLREFSLSRANADATNVDAKLTLVVYLGASHAATMENPR